MRHNDEIPLSGDRRRMSISLYGALLACIFAIMGCQKQPVPEIQIDASGEEESPKYRDPSGLRMETTERGALSETATYYLRDGKRVLHGTQSKRGAAYVEQMDYLDGIAHGLEVVSDSEGELALSDGVAPQRRR